MIYQIIVCFLALGCWINTAHAECPCKKNAKAQPPVQKPFFYLMQLMENRNPKIIVETSALRNDKPCTEESSSFVLANWAKIHGGKVYSVHQDRQALNQAASVAKNYPLQLIESNTVEFLKNFNQPIDVLYLDGPDFDPNNPYPCQQQHLDEMRAAEPHMSPKAIVLIDKCDAGRLKAKLVIDYLTLRKWKMGVRGNQVYMFRP